MKPLLKSWEKTKPTLGYPRQTDSPCPACVKEAREAIIAGTKDWKDLMHEKVGESSAQIVERDGQIWTIKDCPQHGHYEDMMAVDSKFLSWIESQFPGRDIPRTTTRPSQARLRTFCYAAALFSPSTSPTAAT
jgi:uncharacterized radical SAM superfamily Fe-S cluster-containing enzyme